MPVAVVDRLGGTRRAKVLQVMGFSGLQRVEEEEGVRW